MPPREPATPSHGDHGTSSRTGPAVGTCTVSAAAPASCTTAGGSASGVASVTW
ncbi:hypothetical protein [Kitasatospora nipponensis]|uniref:hypothetical protein n=1 Tax=Kitasatospora nipponensis TaxID=258049 RepID=UPI0031D19212